MSQGWWGPDTATMLEISRVPAGPTAAPGQRVSALLEGVSVRVLSKGAGCIQNLLQALRAKGFACASFLRRGLSTG